ncbi:MAG: MSMEG_4193 family putative phosphomutase [Nocardioidaceae bacterium]|nr:MSMEG_4193 family putative phosphomutase [Nocardioidaceae bacterium]
MATLLLVRHGRSTANDKGVLAGRAPGILLDDLGARQAASTAERLASLPLAAVVSSPLERCRQTAEAIVGAHAGSPALHTDDRFTECGYGDWTGQELKRLAKEKLWKVVQDHPSAVTFPGGESIREMQARSVAAARDWDQRITEQQGSDALWVAVSHGDVIKAILADALGTHLDNFQRIVVEPATVSAISYTPLRPFVTRYNEHGDLAGLAPKRKKRRRKAASSDAAVGGGSGS